jgi:hypothetical protein
MNTLQEQRQHYAAVRQRIMAASWYRDPPTERIDLLAKMAPPPDPKPKPSYFFRLIYIEPIGPGLTVLPPPVNGKTVKQILCEVVAKHGIKMWELQSPRRAAPVVAARQEACYRLRVEKRLSLPEIGRKLGGRDHTTVLHGCRAHAKRNALPDVVKP